MASTPPKVAASFLIVLCFRRIWRLLGLASVRNPRRGWMFVFEQLLAFAMPLLLT